MTNTLKLLDPVQGLINFSLDVKPFHTKIVEVLVEYVYTEYIDVTIVDNMSMIVDVDYPLQNSGSLPLICGSGHGYGNTPYGDSGRYPITSPNPSIPFGDYPAINGTLNTIIISGDISTKLIPGEQIHLLTTSEDYSDVVGIVGISTVNSEFLVSGDHTARFVSGYEFDVVGSVGNDGTYTISVNSVYDVVLDRTTLTVDQGITNGVAYGQLGVLKSVIASNTGIFTIQNVEFSGGSIPSWSDTTDPWSYRLGDSPHTIITLLENISTVISPSLDVIVSATMTITPIAIEGIMPYSNINSTFSPLVPSTSQTPDEGHNLVEIVAVQASTLDLVGLPISNTGSYTVLGDFSVSNTFVGDTVVVSDSVNIGEYTITNISYDIPSSTTTFSVLESVVSSVVDGRLDVYIPSNVFIVDGNVTSRFVQGVQFNVTSGGHNSNPHTTIKSDYIDGKTLIRVIDDIITDSGSPVLDIVGGIKVRGDYTQYFNTSSTIYITGSLHNNGPHTLSGVVVYDIASNTSTIPVNRTLALPIDGNVHRYGIGLLTDVLSGYSYTPSICEYVPETLLSVVIKDRLVMSPGHLDLADDLVVHNMENTDNWGQSLPLTTIISATSPIVPHQLTPPVLPVANDLWFDTNVDLLKQLIGTIWKVISKAWWLDSTTNTLHYRTVNKFVDTGWVLDTINYPAANSFIPASSVIEVISSESFIVEVIGGIVQNVIDFTTAVPSSDINLISVAITGVPVQFTLNTPNQITIIDPPLSGGELVVITVSDRSGMSTNAHVTQPSIPHSVFHEYVTSDVVNNVYVVSGGDITHRATPPLRFDGIDTSNNSVLGSWSTKTFPIVDVDDLLGTITIIGDYSWLFTAERVFNVSFSEVNNNSFVVGGSLFDGTYTTIATTYPGVFESPDHPTNQQFYNPGVNIFNIENISNIFIVLGDAVDVYPVGSEILITGSVTGNNEVWTVSSVSLNITGDKTNIQVTGNVPFPDASMNAKIHTPIFQNYSRDLGNIMGAIYDPNVNGVYATNQPKTILVPSTIIDPSITGIRYTAHGPLRMNIIHDLEDVISGTMGDVVGMPNQLTNIPNWYNIIDTNAVGDYITLEMVDARDSLSPGTIFTISESFGDNPADKETNNGQYVVRRSFYDNPAAMFIASGGETKISLAVLGGAVDIYKNGILITPGTDFGVLPLTNELCFGDPISFIGVGVPLSPGDVIVRVPANVPVAWATASGNTIVQIDNDFSNIPPYNSFVVVSVNNNGSSPNVIRLSGNHKALFDSFQSFGFQLDQPLVSVSPLLNIITPLSVVYDSNLLETVLTVGEEFIDELFVGNIGMISSPYKVDIPYDATNTTAPWSHGTVVRDVLSVGHSPETHAITTIAEDMGFSWGESMRWPILSVDNTNVVAVDHDNNPATPNINTATGIITVSTDITNIIDLNDRVNVLGAAENNGLYNISAMVYDIIGDITTITLNHHLSHTTIEPIPDVAGNLDGTYLLLSSATTEYYVWFDVDNNGNDPAVPGKTGIRIHVPQNATVDTISTNLSFGIANNIEFNSNIIGSVVHVSLISITSGLHSSVDISSGFGVINHTLPTNNLGILELEGVDITEWFQYLIKSYDAATSTINVIGNAVGVVQMGQQIKIVGSVSNDAVHTISAPPVFDGTMTTILVTNPLFKVTQLITEISSPTTFKVLGDAYRMVTVGDDIVILNSTGNDGTYVVSNISQQGTFSEIVINSSLPSVIVDGDIEFNERGGWIEPLRTRGIELVYGDYIGVGVGELTDATSIADAGSVMGAWDYPYWDVGSFDESVGTVIHLS